METGAVGCTFDTEDALTAAAKALVEAGFAHKDIHVGAVPTERAQQAAERSGIVADVPPDDPFRGMAGYSGEASARHSVDRAGVWGGALGAVGGMLLSFTPAGREIPVSHALQPLADVLFFFVLGVFVGSVLGGALAPQQSAHAGFRLIDAMNEGSLALVVVARYARLEEVTRLLERANGKGMTQL